MNEDRFATIRSLLGSPSRQHWETLIALFEQWSPSSERQSALQYAREHLRSWPGHIPSIRLSTEVLKHLPPDDPALYLAKRFDFSSEDIIELGFQTEEKLLNCRELTFANGQLDEDDVKALALSPLLTNLRHLNLTNALSDPEELSIFAESPWFPHLTTLILEDLHIGAEHIIPLAESIQPGSLQHLSLKGNELSNFVIDLLEQGHWLDNIKHIDISDNYIDEDGFAHLFRLLPETVEHLALHDSEDLDGCLSIKPLMQLDKFRALRTLDISRSSINDKELKQLFHTSSLPSLRNLLIEEMVEAEHIFRSARGAPLFSQLEALHMGANEFQHRALHRFFRETDFSNLKKLHMLYIVLYEKDIQALQQNETLASLRSLNLMLGGLVPERLAQCKGEPLFEQLTTLDLSFNPLGPEGLALLPDVFSLHTLEELHLHGCALHGLRGFDQFIDEKKSALKKLILSRNALQFDGVEYLCQSPILPQLEYLDLSNTQMSEEALHHLIRHGQFDQLRTLHLANNGLPFFLVRELLEKGHLPNLRVLDWSEEGYVPENDLETIDTIHFLDEWGAQSRLRVVRIGDKKDVLMGEYEFPKHICLEDLDWNNLYDWYDEQWLELQWTQM